MASTTAPSFKILGIVDNVNACDCCGKNNLAKTVAIENLETGNIGYYGTTCAMQPAKCFGLKKSEMNFVLAAYKARQQKVWSMTRALYKAKGGAMIFFDERATGGTIGNRYADLTLRDACEKEIRASYFAA